MTQQCISYNPATNYFFQCLFAKFQIGPGRSADITEPLVCGQPTHQLSFAHDVRAFGCKEGIHLSEQIDMKLPPSTPPQGK